MLEQIKILIVDDHPLMRQGIHQLLALNPDFKIVGETGDGNEAIALATKLSPDLIILDLNMKGLSGLGTLKALRHEGIDARIIILTVSDLRSDIYTLIDSGADGYLLKDSEPEWLLEQLSNAAKGERVFSEAVKNYLATRYEQKDPFSELTERELDVLREVARGSSNKQIATNLHISEETVKVHIRNILRKLNIRSRVAATVLYLEHKGI